MNVTPDQLRSWINDAAAIAEHARRIAGDERTEAVKWADEIHGKLVRRFHDLLAPHLKDGDGSDGPSAG